MSDAKPMTDQDLAAIRERVAKPPGRIVLDEPLHGESAKSLIRLTRQLQNAEADRAALLDEVDRLRGLYRALYCSVHNLGTA